MVSYLIGLIGFVYRYSDEGMNTVSCRVLLKFQENEGGTADLINLVPFRAGIFLF